MRATIFVIAAAAGVVLWIGSPLHGQQQAKGPAAQTSQHAAMLRTYCVGCHNARMRTGGLALDELDFAAIPQNTKTWETVVRKLRVGMMPPPNLPRPPKTQLDGFVTWLESSLDAAADASPNPGRATMHRLNRAEYANAIRDLLDLEIDATALLPPDDESSGFDNIADVLRVSPSLMERYLSASWNISRLAVGNPNAAAATKVYRVRPDLSQDQHIEGMPPGTRGGMLVRHNFPVDGIYEIKVRLWRNTFDLLRGMEDPHEIEIAVDKEQVRTVTVGGRDDFVKMAENPGSFGADLDEKLTVRIPIKAGPHTVTAAAFLRSHAQRDSLVKPFLRTTIDGLDVTGDPSVDRLSIEGPFAASGVSDTPSQRRIFICDPKNANDELPCARRILSTLARKAYRRPVQDRDLEPLLSFYQRARNNGKDFKGGVESALQFILASPEFLFRVEQDPENLASGAVYRLSDLALASRLSFFLWSSIPDDALINVAAQGKLKEPAVMEQQVRRMLADPKASALIDNFAEQWLALRNVKSTAPNMETFPDFDDNLRQAMKEETRLFFESIIKEDRSVMDLLNADYTFVNERLARHYGVPGVYGSYFRKVPVADPNRRGILGQASILTVTSYPNRTSPVQRGKWILTNLLGSPPTPPPPNVPELKENAEGIAPRSLRERMELHRTDAVCAGCHQVMDPIGFALENFDAIGRWRAADDGVTIDPSGKLFNGAQVSGPAELRQMLAGNPDVFVGVMAERMMTFALGRGLESYDMPAVRKVVRTAANRDYRFGTMVLGVVNSRPFQMRMKP